MYGPIEDTRYELTVPASSAEVLMQGGDALWGQARARMTEEHDGLTTLKGT